jgi:hypothetical protein
MTFRVLTLAIAALLAACASTPSNDGIPTTEERQHISDLFKPYYGCMIVETKRYVTGGARPELALDTADSKCSPMFSAVEDYAVQQNLRRAYVTGAYKGARQRGRVVAMDSLTAPR